MFRNIKIGTKILCVVLIISLFTLLLIAFISYSQMLNLTKYSQDANIQLGLTASERSRSALISQAEEYLENISLKQAEGADAVFRQIKIELNAMAEYMEWIYANPNGFSGRPVQFITDAPNEILCAKYMYAPGVAVTAAIRRELGLISNAEYAFSGMVKNSSLLFNIFVGTESGISYRYSPSNAHDPTYDPRQRNWYKTAMEHPGQTLWIDTYVDPFGKITVTCARAFKNSNGIYTGVVATDIIVGEITEKILALRIGTGGYAFLLDDLGAYIAHPRYGKEGFNANPLEEARGSWKVALENMVNDVYGASVVEMDEEERYIFSAPIRETNWKLCISIPVHEIIAPAEETKAEIDSFTLEAQGYIRKTLSAVIMRFIIIFAVSAILVVSIAYVIALTITRPIEELSHDVKKIGGGDLDIKISVNGKDEVAELGMIFNKMTGDLKDYIANIEKITAERERINSELSIAAEIQNDMLPSIFPDFAGNEHFSLYAKNVPAKEVGGDFFDFFNLDEGNSKIALVIADVSGKGVPASLFMVIAKTLIKQQMLQTGDPAGTLASVNKLLCEDNARSMFVTVLICSIDLATGEMIYANGGHNPPLIAQSGAMYQFMELKKGVPPGMLPASKYKQCSMALNPGDKLFLYTDGINEALNAKNEQWGNERFLEAANKNIELRPEAFDAAIRESLSGFVSDAEQSDDITTFVFHYTKRAEQ
jgi:sigma-B regulation protein RsbU (phosphoserine phosphatase)